MDVNSLFEELKGDSDRACSLVAAAALSEGLQKLLAAHFIQLTEEERDHVFFEQNSPLGDFSSRIEVSYAIGLIGSQERDALNVIRRIRNQFAHTVAQINFTNDIIKKECDKLKHLIPQYTSPPTREIFLLSFMTIFSSILDRCNKIIEQKFGGTNALAKILSDP